jgi:hypothetical protein
MRVAALYDIHANLPALEAVLEDVHRAGVDHVLVGGDVLPGPMPGATLALLLGLDIPVQFIHGNGELAVLAQIGVDPRKVTYWGRPRDTHRRNRSRKSCDGRPTRFTLATTTW